MTPCSAAAGIRGAGRASRPTFASTRCAEPLDLTQRPCSLYAAQRLHRFSHLCTSMSASPSWISPSLVARAASVLCGDRHMSTYRAKGSNDESQGPGSGSGARPGGTGGHGTSGSSGGHARRLLRRESSLYVLPELLSRRAADLGGLELDKLIGRGSFGRVYRGDTCAECQHRRPEISRRLTQACGKWLRLALQSALKNVDRVSLVELLALQRTTDGSEAQMQGAFDQPSDTVLTLCCSDVARGHCGGESAEPRGQPHCKTQRSARVAGLRPRAPPQCGASCLCPGPDLHNP